MNTVIPLSNLPSHWTAKQLALIRRTVAKDANPEEFDQFIHICRHTRLDPLRRQIYCWIFHRDDPKKRQMVIVTAIGGYRSIAERTGAYRPDDKAPRYFMGAVDQRTNPLGIERCEVTVYKHSHGEWFPVVGEAWWDEYVPLNYEKTAIDSKKQGWIKMPRIMIAKCAESAALRKAWPDDFAGLNVEEEMDRSHVLDLTATEIADAGEADAKLELMGGKNALTVDWCDGSKLVRVPEAAFCDAVLKWGALPERSPEDLASWWTRNEAARAEYKARHGGEYLEFQKAYEAARSELGRKDGAQEPAQKAHAPPPQAIAAPQEQAAAEPAKQPATAKDDKTVLAHLQKRIKDCASLAELSELESRFRETAYKALPAPCQKKADDMLARAKE